MSLTTYKKKRTSDKTPEPFGGKSISKQLRFVVQKHAASHLHYDFRLEMEGVLKSWAVPKGPSMDPKVKRLAMMVEDHPFDYRDFEGIIPKGNYGGGTVMVWDEGEYKSTDKADADKNMQDKDLRHQLHAGKIKFTLYGEKLKGQFALVKSHGLQKNAWLLMKMADEFATTDDVLEQDRSVLSDKTIEGIQSTDANVYGEEKKKKTFSRSITQPKGVSMRSPVTKTAQLKSSFSLSLRPMLATLVDKPFDEKGWLYEVKWDGYRAMAFMNGHSVELKSRNDKSFNDKFYPITEALKEWDINAVIDGEVVVLNNKGVSNFSALQNWRSEADGTLIYYVFDIIWHDGKDLSQLPLIQRREILKNLFPKNEGVVRISETFETTASEFLAIAKEMGMEGIIAKKDNSTYHSGARTTDWLKIKSNHRQEVVIGGFTRNDDSDKVFSSLLVGVFENKKLVYTGKIGTGFNDKMQKEMMKAFKPLITDKIPFTFTPDVNKPSRFRPNPPHATATWLKPKLVCEVSFVEMTNDGVMRHPSFEGMRSDKDASSVVAEVEVPVEEAIEEEEKKLAGKKVVIPIKSERKSLLNPTEKTQVKVVNGHELTFNNLNKVYWPDDNVTKRDMLNYYYQAAPFILPYLKDRPQSLNRFPNGINGKSFYQKDVTGKVPEWVSTYLYHANGEPEDKHFLVVKEEADILLMASLGCIELNPWSSTIHQPDNPDWCIIDLDPDKNSFDQIIEAANVTRAVLDELKVPSYPKTSGSTGLHIYIPLGAKYTYEQSKEFARVIARLVQQRIPKFTSIERTVADRKGKMYIDFLQNRPQATLAAPYSLRPKPGATVSMPLDWSEVKKGLKMKDFTIFNAIDRMKETGDIFKPVLGEGIDLDKIVKQWSK